MRHKAPFLVLFAAALTLLGCTQTNPSSAIQKDEQSTTQAMERTMVKSFKITDATFSKAYYHPGEQVDLTVMIDNQSEQTLPVHFKIVVTHGLDQVREMSRDLQVPPGAEAVNVQFEPPQETPRGYGLDISLESQSGSIVAKANTSFDVLERWTQTPRYGFLSDFEPDRKDAEQTMALLNCYHINSLQFYDWMYRHEQFLTDQDPYKDLLSRQLSRKTVDALIAAAHERGIAAMPYTAIYGASIAFFKEHPDWALYKADGSPELFGDNFMAIMDPQPGSPWANHLLDQFDQILQKTKFDGIHLDQYGDPKIAYDAQGNKIDLSVALADMINATKEQVLKYRPDGAVVFNAVTNWPIETVAPSKEDIVYIEVWPPYNWFNDLHNLVTQAQQLGGGKAVVLAAYIDPQYEVNVRLMDSVIFASGAGHIELGERALDQIGMLADPYFPKYKPVSAGLGLALQHLYDFSVRYQDYIGPRSQDATRDYNNRVNVGNYSTAPNLMDDKVWPIVRQGEGFTAVNLVNLLGVQKPDWKEPVTQPPTLLGQTTVEIEKVDRQVSRIWFATPDGNDISAMPLQFTQQNGTLKFDIPSLAYWDLIVIEWR